MEDINSILQGRVPTEPPEIKVLKAYFKSEYRAEVQITVSEKDIAIVVNSAALANTLRLRATEIQKACGITKRLRFKLI
jgi:streptomycin 6-kinase